MRTIALCLLLVLTQFCIADWQLRSDRSVLNFVSIKNNQIAEVHRFLELSGTVNTEGLAQVDIKLNSVETNILIRNDRMKSMLFELDLFTVASATAKLDIQGFAGLDTGTSLNTDMTLELDLHGVKSPIAAKVKVTRVTAKLWQVTSVKPMIINASAFNLDQGIEALRAIAGLSSIGTAVPVTFNLEFTKL
jgi:hypothetical protein|tara:strand:- start:32 stop:604 length:573 start_codon:yes stop_codon:yes gene_type:complete